MKQQAKHEVKKENLRVGRNLLFDRLQSGCSWIQIEETTISSSIAKFKELPNNSFPSGRTNRQLECSGIKLRRAANHLKKPEQSNVATSPGILLDSSSQRDSRDPSLNERGTNRVGKAIRFHRIDDESISSGKRSPNDKNPMNTARSRGPGVVNFKMPILTRFTTNMVKKSFI